MTDDEKKQRQEAHEAQLRKIRVDGWVRRQVIRAEHEARLEKMRKAIDGLRAAEADKRRISEESHVIVTGMD